MSIRPVVVIKTFGLKCFRIMLILAICLITSGTLALAFPHPAHAKCLIIIVDPKTGQPVPGC
jgi:hypothetical protein